MTEKRELLCHFLASIAYHLQKALRGAPSDFASFRITPKSRTPQELVRHIDGVLDYARTCFLGGVSRNSLLPTMDDQVRKAHGTIKDLADLLSEGTELRGFTEEQLLQGPFSDAMTHIGQISFLRRLHGSPVPSETSCTPGLEKKILGPINPCRNDQMPTGNHRRRQRPSRESEALQ